MVRTRVAERWDQVDEVMVLRQGTRGTYMGG